MGFVDPRTDFGFKRIFGSDRSKPILRNFLNAIIYNGEPRITDLDILDPYQNPDLYSLKQSILDVKAVLDNQTTVIVEMQVLPVKAFTERILYNTAKAYTSQLKRGEGYLALKPIISLTIVDFLLFPEHENDSPNPISRYQLMNPDTGIRCSNHLELVFAELPKLAQVPEQLGTRCDRWLYFIQQAGKLSHIPDVLADDEFDEAFAIANESQLSAEEYELAEKQRMKIWDEQGQREYVQEEGRKRGLAEGLREGLAEGRREGLREGRQAGAMEIATRMLANGIEIESVCQFTGLSESVVRGLLDCSEDGAS
jgi:predicted transposase/invertase (TIGR01784 family)